MLQWGGLQEVRSFVAIQHGVSRAAYSADIGIGYDSIIQSESTAVHPEKQARLAILGGLYRQYYLHYEHYASALDGCVEIRCSNSGFTSCSDSA